MDYQEEDYEEPEPTPIALDAKTLKLLGVDGEMIQAGVIATVSAQIMRRNADTIAAAVQTQIEKQIAAQINTAVLDVLNYTYTPHTPYGEVAGEPTTIRKEFEKAIKNWWEQKIDRAGEPTNSSYNGEPRHTAIARKVIQELLNTEFKAKMESLVNDGRAAMKAGMTTAIAEAVDRMWK